MVVGTIQPNMRALQVRDAVVVELVELIDPSGWGVGGMAGHAGPPIGPASDVVLPLHSLKKRGPT